MYTLDFHADDYALSKNNSEKIIKLIKDGHLNSISIICNNTNYDECMDLLRKNWDSFKEKPLISVHINIIDGHSISGKCDPFFTWGSVFKCNYYPKNKRNIIKNKIKEEIKAQIEVVYNDIKSLNYTNAENNSFSEYTASSPALRLDSHVHTHMIPIVFEAMLEAVNELNLSSKLSFVRISKEPLFMFLTTPGIIGTFPIINLIKNLILRFYARNDIRLLNRSSVPYSYLWGLNMSGHMDKDRINILMPKMIKYISRRSDSSYLEILGHPGIVYEEESKNLILSNDDYSFVISENRNIEYDAMVNCCPLKKTY